MVTQSADEIDMGYVSHMSLVRCKKGGISIAEAGIRTSCFVVYNFKIGWVLVRLVGRH